MDIQKYVVDFLLNNGFERIHDTKYSIKHRKKICKVIINTDHYEIISDGGHMYSKDLNIYWLVGLLTWYEYIPKNYKK